MRTRRLAVPLLAAAALTAGCGGEDALSASEYRKQADAACRDAEKRIEGIKTPTTAAGLKPYLDETFAAAKDTQGKLEALEPPSDLEAAHDRYVKATKTGVDRLEAVIEEAGDTPDPAQLQKVGQDLQATGRQADAAATELKLEDCGN